MSDAQSPAKREPWSASRTLGVVHIAVGAVFGGAGFAYANGLAYHLIVGMALIGAGVQIFRARVWGARWFFAVFVGALIWALWESGLDFRRLVSRTGVMMVLAIATALMLPRLPGKAAKEDSWMLAAVLSSMLIFSVVMVIVSQE